MIVKLENQISISIYDKYTCAVFPIFKKSLTKAGQLNINEIDNFVDDFIFYVVEYQQIFFISL